MTSMHRIGSLNLSFLRAVAVGAIVLGLLSNQSRAVNDLLAKYTFDNEITVPYTPPDTTDSAIGPIVYADQGALTNIATLFGQHAGAATDWTSPAGNGSIDSYSANTWAAGDYWQIQANTVGVTNLGLQFDQVSSPTGPRDFKVQYSTDGTVFSDFANYVVQPNATPSWSSAGAVAPAGLDTYNFDLRTITALNNQASVYFRLTALSPVVAAAPGSNPAASGTNRIDNVTIYNNYDPTMAPVPQPVTPVLPVAGNVVLGINSSRAKTTLELLQGIAVASGGSKTQPYSPWTATAFIQAVKFDNLGGTAHNVKGNLLGVDFGGSAAVGGAIYSFATQGSVPAPAGQLIGNTTGLGETAVDTTRLTGLSVSPSNNKIAVIGSDKGTVIVYDYTAGNTTGSGAALANGRQTAASSLPVTSQGTAWKDNNTVLAFSTAGKLYEVADSGGTLAAPQEKASVTPGTFTTMSTALAYNPAVSQYVYALFGGFTPATPGPAAAQNWLYVFDPATNYSLLNTVDLGNVTTVNTVRDLAMDAAGNLFISRNATEISVIPNAAANAATITGASAVKWYQSDVFGSTFNGLDIGFAATALAGDYNSDGKVNAADYVMWRNDPGSFGGPGGYNTWRANFGAGSGSGAGLGESAAVPEPAAVALVLLGLSLCGWKRRGR